MFLASCGPPVNSQREAQQRPTFRPKRTAIENRQYTCSLNVSTDSEHRYNANFGVARGESSSASNPLVEGAAREGPDAIKASGPRRSTITWRTYRGFR